MVDALAASLVGAPLLSYAILSRSAATVFALIALASLLALRFIFPSRRRRLTEEERLLWARAALSLGGDSCPYNLFEHMTLVGSKGPGRLTYRIKLCRPLHNFLGSMHGGAIASAIDVATSAAIVSTGAFPGVSTSLGVSYLAGCAHDEEVRVEADVLKLGATLAYTEARLFRASDGALMARGWHVKYVVAPRAFAILLALRPELVCRLLRSSLRGPLRTRSLGGRTFTFGERKPPAACTHEYDPAVEPQTGLARDDAGTRAYFSTFGEEDTVMQGWDKPVQQFLVLTSGGRHGSDELPSVWRLKTVPKLTNSFGALHGGCTASLVDVLGSAQIAFGDEHECGVAVNLDVQYASSAKSGEVVEWSAKMLKRGGRLATVEVRATGKNGRLVAVGTVTKSLRGKPKPK